MAESNGITLEEIVSKWTIKTDLSPLEQGRQALKGLAINLGLIGAQVAGAAAGLFELASSTAEAGDQAAKAAVKYGLTAKAYQELMFMARGEADFLNMGLLFLNKNMSEAAKGSKEAAASFSNIGVSLTQGGKLKSADQVLMDIADKFSKMPADARRTKAAVEIFGRQGASLLPFLTRTREDLEASRREANEFGYVISDTEAAEKFKDSFEDMHNILKGFRNTVGVELIPVINDVMADLKDFLRVNRELIVTDLRGWVREGVNQFKVMVGFLWNMYRAANSLARMFGGFGTIIKVVTRAMQAFLALSTLFYLGRLAQAVFAAVKAWQAMGFAVKLFGNEALIAWMKALWPAVAVGAAVAAVLLILEDLYTFFSGGGESLTGDLVHAVGDGLKWLGEKMIAFGKYINDSLIQYMSAFAAKIRSFFQPVMDVIDWISKKVEGFGQGGFMKAIQKFSGFVTGGVASAMASAPTAGMAMGLTPTLGSIGQAYTSSVMQSQPTINQTINVGAGTDPLATGKAVGGQTENALGQSYREAARTFSAQGDH